MDTDLKTININNYILIFQQKTIMKRILNLLSLVLILVATLSSCSFSTVDADEEAVLVKQPWFIGHGGV